MDTSLQEGKTTWCHYNIAYHLVWIPKYRKKILTGEIQVECKKLIGECCSKHEITLLTLETDIDHIHVFVSAPPRFSPSKIVGLLKGFSSKMLTEKFPKNVRDFQARRANLKYRLEDGGKPRFLHTLNGSGLGLPRTLIAVMENNQQADGSIIIHEVLRPGMGGVDAVHP